MIMYAWGDASAEVLQELLDLHPRGNAVAVHVDMMANAFAGGAARFREPIEVDGELATTVAAKFGKVFPATTQHDRLAELARHGVPGRDSFFCGS